MSSVAIYKLWRSWKTIIEMLIDREYNLDSYFLGEQDTSYEYFMNWIEAEMEKEYPRIEGYKDFMDKLNEEEDGNEINEIRTIMNFSLDTIFIFWKDSVGIGDIQSIIEILNEVDFPTDQSKHAIVVYNNKITPTAAAAIKPLRFQKIIIETFWEKELQYNVTRHKDVPEHIICSKETKEKLFELYAVDKEKITKIPVTDPVCRYYGVNKGQLIKIKRRSDAIPEVTINGEKKVLYDITYKIVS